MDELDLLKKDWKRNENSFHQVTEKEIYEMLHKRSSSIVKWILMISIIEVLFWAGISLLSGNEDYLTEWGCERFRPYMTIFEIFNYVVILVFIYLFYRNYIRISTTSSTKELMLNILRTRKTVKYYVWYNLAMVMLITVFAFTTIILFSPKVQSLREGIKQDSFIIIIVIGIGMAFIAFLTTFLWLVYRLVYGILLRKLLTNYKELKKIDL